MRPSATSVCGLKLLLYAALSYWCVKLREYEALSLSYADWRAAFFVEGLEALSY